MAWKQIEALLEKQGIFMGAKSSYEKAQAVIVGLPMDFTVSYRPGARSGPLAIRNVSQAIEEYSFYQGA
jgi:agmatinase